MTVLKGQTTLWLRALQRVYGGQPWTSLVPARLRTISSDPRNVSGSGQWLTQEYSVPWMSPEICSGLDDTYSSTSICSWSCTQTLLSLLSLCWYYRQVLPIHTMLGLEPRTWCVLIKFVTIKLHLQAPSWSLRQVWYVDQGGPQTPALAFWARITGPHYHSRLHCEYRSELSLAPQFLSKAQFS